MPSRAIVEVRAIVAADQRGQRRLGLEGRRVGEHLLPQCADRVPAHRDLARRIGHDRLRLVQGGDAGGVPGVGALDEQAGQVVRLEGFLVESHAP